MEEIKPEVMFTSTGLIQSPGCIFYYLREVVTITVKAKVGSNNEVRREAYTTTVEHPFACVAVRNVYYKTGNVEDRPQYITRGISLCGHKDNFSKKEGRAIAYKRLRMAETGTWHDTEFFQDPRLEAFLGKQRPACRTRVITAYEKTILAKLGKWEKDMADAGEEAEEIDMDKLKEVLEHFELQSVRDTGVGKISGGFANAEYKGVSDGKIAIELRWGVQSDCQDDVHVEDWTLDVDKLDSRTVGEIVDYIDN